jgi:hypothetical protein
MEQMMRELVIAAADLGLQQAIEQGAEQSAQKDIEFCCGGNTKFVGKRESVLWTVSGKVGYQRRYLIGSDTIESTCKQIAAEHLKRSGVRWKLASAIATYKAKAARLGNTLDILKPIYPNLSASTP